MKVKGVLWDMDGTLLDTEKLSDEAMILAIQDLFENCECPTLDDFDWPIKKRIIGTRSADWVPIIENWVMTLSKGTATKREGVSLVDRWEHHLQDLCSGDNLSAIDGAAEMVEFFASHNIPQAIATSSSQDLVANKCTNETMKGLFFNKMKDIITGDMVSNGKPAPDMYLLAASRIEVSPADCIVFEDSAPGCISGRAAKAGKVFALPDPRYSGEERAELFSGNCDFIFRSSWSELVQNFQFHHNGEALLMTVNENEMVRAPF